MQEGILLKGLKELQESNTQKILSMTKPMNDKWENMATQTKEEVKNTTDVNATATSATTTRFTKLTKPAKVPSWTKDMSLETYTKQIATWTGINEDVPEYVKYHDLMKELKGNKHTKGIQKYTAEHILPVLVNQTDQTLDNFVGLLDIKHGRLRTEKVKDVIEGYLKFKEDRHEDEDELILAMK